MDAQPLYRIRGVDETDAAQINTWRALPHVRRWWGDPTLEPISETLRDPRLALWIVELAEQPLAFIQDYAVHDWSPHHFDYLPMGARGMDVYVGDPSMLGLGHGSRLLRQHVDQLFRSGVPAVGIDPHPENSSARRAFEKAGFVLTGGPVESRWSRAMLMERHAALPAVGNQ